MSDVARSLPVGVLQKSCADCGAVTPDEVGDYTLISARFGWRLARETDSSGCLRLSWRCPSCWERRKASSAGTADGPATPVTTPDRRRPLVLLLDSQDNRREALRRTLTLVGRLRVEGMGWPELRRLPTIPESCVVYADDPLARMFVNTVRAHLPSSWLVSIGRLDGVDEALVRNGPAEDLARALANRLTP
jgi:hypothetical protein